MSFIIRNIANNPIEINDLGILVDTNADVDLIDQPAHDIAVSDDLINAIQNGNIVVLDPLDGTSPLTIAQSVEAVRVSNDPSYRIRGGRLQQLEDVANTVPLDGQILSYDQISQLWKPVSSSGTGGSNNSVKETITQTSHGFTTGTPIYFDGTIWKKAKADNVNTLATAVVDKIDNDNFFAVSDGDITTLTGLTTGEWYYVSDTVAGTLTTTEPISTYSNPIGFAESSTKLHVQSIRAVDLGGGQSNLSREIVYQQSHGFTTGTPIYFDGTLWKKAKSDNINTLATATVNYIDDDNFELVIVGSITTNLNTLVPGSWYYVSDVNEGELTSTEPTISNPIGVAESSSKLMIVPLRAVDYTNT